MEIVNKIIGGLLLGILGLALIGSVVYLGFGPSVQQQTNDQANQTSGLKNNPANGTVTIPAITGSETPSQADTFK
ncbi:hypothetical protein [Brevibacillus sp. SYSU BS000544]|uniref:hypothetical protein n=1 Tax=Brevibacillus sp. SYSU BS000544 TaxID=3416443 RepID=UPI003CE4A9A5